MGYVNINAIDDWELNDKQGQWMVSLYNVFFIWIIIFL